MSYMIPYSLSLSLSTPLQPPKLERARYGPEEPEQASRPSPPLFPHQFSTGSLTPSKFDLRYDSKIGRCILYATILIMELSDLRRSELCQIRDSVTNVRLDRRKSPVLTHVYDIITGMQQKSQE